MALTPSTMLQLGTKAPDFALPDTENKTWQLSDFSNKAGLLVIFMCNHCPYVIHIKSKLAELTQKWQQENLSVVAINANDVNNYPDDSPEKMHEEKLFAGYTFPYLFDDSQQTAKAYEAACTPDFFLFNKELSLVYRGQFDDSRPGNNLPVTGQDLQQAVEAVLSEQTPSLDQKASIGCNIKWKPGNEPAYF